MQSCAMANSLGTYFKLTTYGESHGEQIGGVIDGCPSNIALDIDAIQKALDARKPGDTLSSQRKEEDLVHFTSGIFQGKTTGMPLHFYIKNKDAKSKDYQAIKDVYRPSHADFTYAQKYGHRDYRGGGRQSARETANWVVAGAVAKQILAKTNIQINADIHQAGPIKNIDATTFQQAYKALIEQLNKEKDSVGGIIHCTINNLPVGLGAPIFDKFHARLAQYMLTINTAKGFEIGAGFESAHKKGSELNDAFTIKDNAIKTTTNHSGGVLGGITNGMPVNFKVLFKPVSSIGKAQHTIDQDKQPNTLEVKGRHDACVLHRAVPIVQAMAWLVVVDFYLEQQLNTK